MTPGGGTSAWSARRLTLVALALAAGATLLVAALPFIRFAYEAPALHVALETGEALIALVVAYLAIGRFRAMGRLQDLLLAVGLAVLAAANLVLTAVPAAVALSGGTGLTRWTPLLVRLFGTSLIAAAALVGAQRLITRQRLRPALAAGVVMVVVLGAAGLLLGDHLPPAVDPDVDLQGGRVLVLAGHPLVLGAQVLTGLLYAVAALRFTQQAGRDDDELVRWLGPACAVAAVARVGYLLFPSLYSQYVCVGDLLRLAFYVLLLVGAAREVRSYWSRVAVLEDRRRLARDLHDGLTQELSYIWSQTRQLTSGSADPEAVQRINGAAARALDEARGAIAALARTSPEGFHDVLHATAEGLSSRYDAKVGLDLDESVPVSPAEGDAILRIVAEAFRNGVLHGGAACVTVQLSGAPLRLVVTDDGAGFDAQVPRTSGAFGLTSMRERAETLGATFSLESRQGKGTVVTVVWP